MSRDAALATRAGGGGGGGGSGSGSGVKRVQVTICDQEQRVGRIWVDADADYSRVAAHIERGADVDRRGRDRAFWSALQPGALAGDGRTALAARMRLVSAGPRYVVWNSCPFKTVDEIAAVAVVAPDDSDVGRRHLERKYTDADDEDDGEFVANGSAAAASATSATAYATHILLLLSPGAVVLLVECRLPPLGTGARDGDANEATRIVATTTTTPHRARAQTYTFVASRRTLLKHAATLEQLFAYVARKSGCCGAASRGSGGGGGADEDSISDGVTDVVAADLGESRRDRAFHSPSIHATARSYSTPSRDAIPVVVASRPSLPAAAAAAAAVVPISHTVMTDQHTLDYFRHLEHPTAYLGDTHLPVFVVHHLPTASFTLDSRRVALVLFLVFLALVLRWVFGDMLPTEFVRWSRSAVTVCWQALA